MTQAREDGYLAQMVSACRQIGDYISGMDYAGFRADKRTQDAVVLNLIVLGEAASRMLGEFPDCVDRYPDIPWRNIKGMRNRIAHGYFEIDLNVVWDTVNIAMPQLLAHLPQTRTDQLPRGD